MNASDTTPPEGKESAESYDYRHTGQHLLRSELEQRADDLRSVFFEVSRKAEAGEEIDIDDYHRLCHVVEQAGCIVDVVGESVDCTLTELEEDRQ
jgi:hypothetical protein